MQAFLFFKSPESCYRILTIRTLRSLLVMYLTGFTFIDKYVKELKDTTLYAYLSGFSPGNKPSKAYLS